MAEAIRESQLTSANEARYSMIGIDPGHENSFDDVRRNSLKFYTPRSIG